MPPTYPHIFVTVGTTEFQALIDAVNTPEAAAALRLLGCQRLSIQYGSGRLDRDRLRRNYADIATCHDDDLFDYRPSIRASIASADLVISHAGAGSCIGTLQAGKPMLVVVNERLMDNHQLELADRLHADAHIFRCVPGTLVQTLGGAVRTELLCSYRPGNAEKCVLAVDKLLGFV